MKLYPIKFKPRAVEASWGGNAIREKFGKVFSYTDEDGNEKILGDDILIGESIEIADLGEIADSVAANGFLAGNTLSEISETYIEEFSGDNISTRYGTQFPIMVRLLDVQGRMPVYVCPDDETAFQRYDALGGNECWYIMECGEGAAVYAGLKSKTTAEEIYRRCMDGSITEIMNRIVPQRGDIFIFRPGTLFCAERGIVAASIRESSAVTFNLSAEDMDERLDQLSEALDIMNLEAFDPKDYITHSHGIIAEEDEFVITKIELEHETMRVHADDLESALVYICVKGSCTISDTSLARGESLVIPACWKDVEIVPGPKGCILLEARVPQKEEKDDYIRDEN